MWVGAMVKECPKCGTAFSDNEFQCPRCESYRGLTLSQVALRAAIVLGLIAIGYALVFLGTAN